jgi:Fe-Mn family superoxide dismutase
MFTRRDGLKWTLALAATAEASAKLGLVSPVLAAGQTFKVPPLGYGYDALEPYIDTQTMTIHHDRHHAAYVAALNGIVEKYPDFIINSPAAILSDLSIVPEALRAPARNNLGGHWNHSFFWELEHVPKKLLDFFDQDMLQLFDFERVLIDQMIPFDRDAL